MRCVVMFLLLLGIATVVRAEPDVHDTKLLTHPAVSKDHIAFIYADDLWIADIDGRNVRRLTSDTGVESHPVFAPDGQSIAFSAQYDGNTDVYLISIAGGAPKRLTWHPDPDVVRGFTPDGKAVLFSSPRAAFAFNNRHQLLYTVPVEGGMPTKVPLPNGFEASYSPDGKGIAYNPNSDRSKEWKNYRGGTHGRIWICRFQDLAVVEVPQPEGRCNDLDPNWVGDKVYFRSDRNGEYNLFSYDVKTKKVAQLTTDSEPIIDVNSGGGRIIFERAGHLHLFDPVTATSKRLQIGVATDLIESRPRYVKGSKFVRQAAISPSGARAVFEFRGEIVTLPAEKGDPRNLTNSPGVHDRSPAWSPDGRSIAWFADEGGEYQLHVRSADGKGASRRIAIQGAGFYERPVWSPDSKKLAFIDNSQSLYWMDLDNGKSSKIASEPNYGPAALVALRPAWSPDSHWIAYALGNKAAYHTIFVHDVTSGKSTPITDGLDDALDPVFDASGKYLYFFSSTDAGPVNHWFSQAGGDARPSRKLHLCVLKKGVRSPLTRESDEERGPMMKKEVVSQVDAPPPAVVIDFGGIDRRIIALPETAGNFRSLQAGAAGQFFYLESPAAPRDTAALRGESGPPGSTLRKFDLARRRSEAVQPGVSSYVLAANGRKALVFGAPDSWSIIDVSGALGPPKKLKVDAIEVKIDPRAEWPQIYREAWRINRDYFYDPNFHGADWEAVRRKYEAFLPHLATRGDLDRVIGWMLSELAVGHSRYSPGERIFERKAVPGGLLGADYEVADGRYRFKKVYAGLASSPELRSPLTAPGVDVQEGEYLLAVGGVDVKPPAELYAHFENTAGKSIEITIGPKADGSGSRVVTLEPLASESALRNLNWVQENIAKVNKATKGRVAYVYVPNTSTLGHAYFKRFFYPQCDKDAIIVDERFNSGGQVADYYIDHLRRPFTSMWKTRYGEDLRTPGAAILGPKAMLINENAGSGGDLLPWMFRKYKLGPLVGKRTWGGLVGVLGFPVLMDGGTVTAPNLAFWTAEDGYAVENEGVPPDVDVEQWPVEVAAGKDPQLDKAIDIVMCELEKNPPQRTPAPPTPIRARKP
jgi:tricorn protease